MKKIFLVLAAAVLAACGPGNNDTVREARQKNAASSIDEDISKFVTATANEQMLDLEQGKLAVARAQTPALRRYSAMMVKDQSRMLSELRILAASKNITLPTGLSKEKTKELEKLKQMSGSEFEKEFIKSMREKHEHKAEEFNDALNVGDDDIREYVNSYLPMIRSHIEEIDFIQKSRQGVADASEVENH